MNLTRTWTLWALMTAVCPAMGGGAMLGSGVLPGMAMNAGLRANPGQAALPAFSREVDVAADVRDLMPSVGPVLVGAEIRTRALFSRSA